MNQADRKSIAQQSTGFADTVQAIINRSCFIDYGIIKDKPASGVVTVEVSVAKNSNDIKIITCVLANIASSTFTLDVVPEVGDKVLVVYPRRYSDDMFDVDKNEAIVEETASGYNLLSGIAILVNQYRKNQHNNFLQIKEGEIVLKLAYDKDKEANLFNLETNKDGTFTIKALENDKFSLSLNKDGGINLKQNNTVLDVNKDDEITIDNGKATIKVDKNGNVSIDAKSGKISLKNSTASLYTILNGMFQILNSSLATAGSPASHTVVPQQFAQQSTQLGQLMQ